MGPMEFRLSGGGGAGRFGRVKVCGTAAAVRKEYNRGRDRSERGKGGENSQQRFAYL